MRTQASERQHNWHEFPIDPVATMVLRLGQMRLALDPTTILKIGRAKVIKNVHSQLGALKRLMTACTEAPWMAVLIVILDRIDQALTTAELDFAKQAISNLERALSRVC